MCQALTPIRFSLTTFLEGFTSFRLQELTEVTAWGHTANKGRSQDLTLTLLTPKPMLLKYTIVFPLIFSSYNTWNGFVQWEPRIERGRPGSSLLDCPAIPLSAWQQSGMVLDTGKGLKKWPLAQVRLSLLPELCWGLTLQDRSKN